MSVTAFIPVRAGSKSIPLKNIKDFCGRPLVYWTVKAASETAAIDRIVVATDSSEIKTVVESFNFPKVSVYDREAKNATDTSSTESVMLEFLQKSDLTSEDTFILIQATSPMLTSADLENGLKKFETADSVLSAVRNKRFFWSDDGKSLNYDYMNRPRRQDFNGMLMENGAFYINSVGNILKSGNRICGRIAVCEMPEYTALEIDETDDWIIMESLMYKHILRCNAAKNIKLVLTDVDGVLTDGGMYYSEDADESKKFNARDGMGFQLLRESGVKTGIITSENTQIVARRAAKLKVDFLVQDAGKLGGKLAVVKKICTDAGFSLEEIAYIGDDINCLELLSKVGLSACPANAMREIKAIPGIIILSLSGGQGAFREFVNLILGR